MMNNTLKSLSKPRPGTIITGKWHRNSYRIIKELGRGANGIVYLVQAGGKEAALKISGGMSVASEVNVLKSLAKVRDSLLGPSLIDVDDWIHPGGQTPFYVMEYIDGPDFLTFIKKNDRIWTEVLILQLLKDLHGLHTNGWIFGDLKPENLIVTGPPPRIRCIDVGGTTLAGRAIKEFTEKYDRGYWGLGGRRAEPSYDLFSVAMLMIAAEYGDGFAKQEGGLKELRAMVMEREQLRRFSPVLMKAFEGHYHSADEMRLEMLALLNDVPGHGALRRPVQTAQGMSQPMSRQMYRKRKRKTEWLETVFIVTVISLIYFFYLFTQGA